MSDALPTMSHAAKPGKDLDVLEKMKIRELGGIRNRGGKLVNKCHQMSDENYKKHGGTADKPY